ncbi:MAG: copper homeostasis protein CutC [Bacteroidota bacterium]
MQVEVCANSWASAQIAASVGADRIELCQNLMVGGLTPSAAVIRNCAEHLSLATMVLIRPRTGDFCYTEEELRLMCEDIRYCKAVNAAGVVVGALEPSGKLDYEACARLRDAAVDQQLTFHRAFDFVSAPEQVLDQLVSLGYDRILSSGQQPTAFEGRALLQSLVQYAGDRITILAGGGIHADNVHALVKATGIREVHLSAKALKKSAAQYQPTDLPLNADSFPEFDYYETSRDKLLAVMQQLGRV